MRIILGTTPGKVLRLRVRRVNKILDRAEKLLRVSLDKKRELDPRASSNLRKKARDGARHAMKIMGILMIEFGMSMPDLAQRARKVALDAREKAGTVG